MSYLGDRDSIVVVVPLKVLMMISFQFKNLLLLLNSFDFEIKEYN